LRSRAVLEAALCMAFWGLSYYSIKTALETYPPMSLGMLRFAAGVVFLFFMKRRSERKTGKREPLAKADIPLLAGAGLTGVTLYFFFENNGIARISVSEAGIIGGAIPVITLVAEAVFMRRRMGALRWAGAAVSLAGVALVSGVSLSADLSVGGSAGGLTGLPDDWSASTAAGYLFMAATIACWVAYSFITPALFTRRSQTYIVFWQSVFGLAGFLPFALPEVPRWGAADIAVLLHIAFLGGACTALAYRFYANALQTLGVGAASLFINLVPAVAVLSGFVLMGDRLSPLQLLGAALAVGGVIAPTMPTLSTETP
jgi:drug/metabolite transporter (DMT)-like permease